MALFACVVYDGAKSAICCKNLIAQTGYSMAMKQANGKTSEKRTAIYDPELMVEAYQFQGVMQAFPNHFHEHYVIGFIERGRRNLKVRGGCLLTAPGDLLLFNPGENHACEAHDDQPLDYRCINIEPIVMAKAVQEIFGIECQPQFEQPVVFRCELTEELRELHTMILRGERGVRKEEKFYFLLEQLLRDYAEAGERETVSEPRAEVKAVCDYLTAHAQEQVSLDTLSEVAGLSKYHLLRAFTKETGITPYRYLETIRIDQAKALLKQGVSPAEAALSVGFSDQSHFSNAFKCFIGLTPGQYRRVFDGNRAQDKSE
ncbi:HTH-type transcriptional activator RhaS [bioreactor metagenome]|uniref:HTH-type transcriptional activator RhaS n=1 Tax=bioreactor metagenome TaxID=1076179 RepID=A0A644ZHS9_9ZZZZ